MKKNNQIIFSIVVLAALTLTSSCKKETEPGPAGADGANGSRYPYKQAGTTLNLEGTFNSGSASLNNSFTLPFFETLEENRVKNSGSPARTSGTIRTSGDGVNEDFYIVRYDSLGNSTLSFDIRYNTSNDIYVNDFHFNVKTNITETSYKNVYTTYSGGGARVSGPYDYESGLTEYNMTNDGNSFAITNWNYNSTTKVLSFEYDGVLTGYYNSTGNELNVSGTVKANLKDVSLRQGK